MTCCPKRAAGTLTTQNRAKVSEQEKVSNHHHCIFKGRLVVAYSVNLLSHTVHQFLLSLQFTEIKPWSSPTQSTSYLFEGKPATGWISWVYGVSETLQGRRDGITVGLLKPGFMRRLRRSCCDAAHVIQGKNHGTHQSGVLFTHYGDLFIPADQQIVSGDQTSPVRTLLFILHRTIQISN